jgi:P27 family predicted phage terminase small subunit
MTGPKHLSLPARRLFDGIHKLYELEAHDDAVLVKALEAWDRAEQARVVLATEGLTVTSRFGEVRVHPLVAVERDSRSAFLAAMRQLGLDYEPTPAHKRTAAAREARWSA